MVPAPIKSSFKTSSRKRETKSHSSSSKAEGNCWICYDFLVSELYTDWFHRLSSRLPWTSKMEENFTTKFNYCCKALHLTCLRGPSLHFCLYEVCYKVGVFCCRYYQNLQDFSIITMKSFMLSFSEFWTFCINLSQR